MRFQRYVSVVAIASLLLAVQAVPLPAQQALPAEESEADLITVLQSDTELFAKAKACQRLAVIGTKESVPVLAKLLSDAQMAHYARYALEPNPDPAVDDVLRDALTKLDGKLLIGVVNSVGARGDAKAVGQLSTLLGSANAEVTEAVATALGRIASPEAVAALHVALGKAEPLRSSAAKACLTAADILLSTGKSADAAALYDLVRKAEAPEYLRMAALSGVMRAQGAEAMPLLAECLKSDNPAQFRVGLQTAHKLGGPEVAQRVVDLIELPGPVEIPKEGTVIQKAEYGAGDRWADVTAAAIAAAASGQPIVASNSLAGDPTPGVVKSLRIVFSKDGQREMVELAEGRELVLEGVLAGPQYPRQVTLIRVLGDLGQKNALPVVLKAAESDAVDIRYAAIVVLGGLGDERAVPVLLKAAADGALAARQSLIDLQGEGVDAVIAEALASAQGPERLVLLQLAGDRAITSLVPTLMKAADDADPQVVTKAIAALGATVGPNELSALVARLIGSDSADVVATVNDALKMALPRMPDCDAAAEKLLAAMPKASVAAQINLLDLLGVFGGDRALAGVAAAVGNSNDEIQDAATRVLGEWMSPDVAPLLLDLAKTGPAKYQVRCLRGYIRAFRQLGIPDAEKMAMAAKAFGAATRDEERCLALESLNRIPDPKAMETLLPHLRNPALKAAAAKAAVAVAERIVAGHPAIVAEAMPKVLATDPDAETAGKARRWLSEAKSRLGGN